MTDGCYVAGRGTILAGMSLHDRFSGCLPSETTLARSALFVSLLLLLPAPAHAQETLIHAGRLVDD